MVIICQCQTVQGMLVLDSAENILCIILLKQHAAGLCLHKSKQFSNFLLFRQENCCLMKIQMRVPPVYAKATHLLLMNQTHPNAMLWRARCGSWKRCSVITTLLWPLLWKYWRNHLVWKKQTSQSTLIKGMISCSNGNAKRLPHIMHIWSFKFPRELLVKACRTTGFWSRLSNW